MRVTGLYYGAQLLRYVGFPTAEVLGPEATREQLQGLIDRHGEILVKPIFRGGAGKKGKAGLIGRVSAMARSGFSPRTLTRSAAPEHPSRACRPAATR